MRWVPLFGPTAFVVVSLVGFVWGVGAILNEGWCPGSAEGGCTSLAALLAVGGILVPLGLCGPHSIDTWITAREYHYSKIDCAMGN